MHSGIIIPLVMCISFEIYHLVLHNTLYEICLPYYKRRNFLKTYTNMIKNITDICNISSENESGNLYQLLVTQKHDYRQMFDIASSMYPPTQAMETVMLDVSTQTCATVLIKILLEFIYLGCFIWLVINLPFRMAIIMAIIISIISIIRVVNEVKCNTKIKKYYIFDSIACLCLYLNVIKYI